MIVHHCAQEVHLCFPLCGRFLPFYSRSVAHGLDWLPAHSRFSIDCIGNKVAERVNTFSELLWQRFDSTIMSNHEIICQDVLPQTIEEKDTAWVWQPFKGYFFSVVTFLCFTGILGWYSFYSDSFLFFFLFKLNNLFILCFFFW